MPRIFLHPIIQVTHIYFHIGILFQNFKKCIPKISKRYHSSIHYIIRHTIRSRIFIANIIQFLKPIAVPLARLLKY